MLSYLNLVIQNFYIRDNVLHFESLGKNFQLKLPIAGSHFLQNALAAILACSYVGVSPEFSVRVLSGFCGVKRRMEFKGIFKNCKIYDDYGHHPTEIRAVLRALSDMKTGSNKTHVIFQPHRFSRTRDLKKEIGESLSGADFIYLLPIYSAGESTIPGINSEILIPNIQTTVIELSGQQEDDTKIVSTKLVDGDILLTLGAGNVLEWGEFLLKKN